MSALDFSEDIKKAIEVMKKGGVILYPTDTIWGLGCDAQNENAIKKIYEIKRRAESKSMLCLVDSIDRIYNYVDDVPEIAEDLIDLAIKPITIIYEGAKNLPISLIGEDKTIGIRVTKEAFSKELCRRFSKAIISTSANISGEKSPAKFSEISDEIKKLVDYIVTYRQNDNNTASASQIIKLGKNGEVKVIRE